MPPSSDGLPLPGKPAPKPAPRPPDHPLARSGPPLFPASWEKAARQRSATDRTLLYVVAVAVSLVGGMVMRALEWGGRDSSSLAGTAALTRLDMALAPTISMVAVGAFITAVTYGVLLRSWWSLLAAPAAFLAGVLLWHTGDVGVQAAVAAISAHRKSWEYWGQMLASEVSGEVWLLVWRCAVPAVLGAALGTVLARRGAVRQVRRPGGAGGDAQHPTRRPSYLRHSTAER